MSPLPLASVSLDLDNLWSYQKTHGDPRWEARGSYLGRFIPPVLDLLDELNLKITFFIVGRDADHAADAASLSEITRRGHEVGNHSYEHEPWLHTYSREQLAAEIENAERAIESVTGQRPCGFRGPGYSWSKDLLHVLVERGYIFDASTLPTWIGPMARWYYFRTSRLSAEERKVRRHLFGGWKDGLRPLKPYRWQLSGGNSILEIPVSTMPFVRTPFHLSYLLYLSRVNDTLMDMYLGAALSACRVSRMEPSYLLHPLDLLGGDQVRELTFFPGMDLAGARKREICKRVLRRLSERFTLVPMSRHAAALNAASGH